MADAFTRLDGCGADAELIGLAKRCLSADAAGRPGDAGEVASAVTAYRESVERRLARRRWRTRRRGRRRRRVGSVGVCGGRWR